MIYRKRAKRNYPLHVHITVMFIILVIAISSVQIWIASSATDRVLLRANDNIFDLIISETKQRLSSHFSPTLGLLDAYSYGDYQALEFSNQQRAKESSLLSLLSLLKGNPNIQSYKVVYPNGDWFGVYREVDGASGLLKPEEFSAYHFHVDSGILEQKRYNQQLIVTMNSQVENNRYDPRQYAWFHQAKRSVTQISKPYQLSYFGKNGITLYRGAAMGGVISADILLEQVSYVMEPKERVHTSLKLLFDDQGYIYAHNDPLVFEMAPALKSSLPLKLTDIKHPLISQIPHIEQSNLNSRRINFEGDEWIVKLERFETPRGHPMYLLLAIKSQDLLLEAHSIATDAIVVSLVALLLTLPVIYYLSQWISKPIRLATAKAKSIQHFDFRDHFVPKSNVAEIMELSQALNSTQDTIGSFFSITNVIAKEQDLDELQGMVCKEIADATLANSTYLYLLSDDESFLEPQFIWFRTQGYIDVSEVVSIPLDDELLAQEVEAFFSEKQAIMVKYDEARSYIPRISLKDNLLFVPLVNRTNNVVGALALGFDERHKDNVLLDNLDLIKTLAGYAAIAIEARSMLQDQQQLLDSFIKVMAGAIDTKSPYTGNHCQRVPELTKLLTRAAHNSQHHEFKDFHMTDENWEGLHIAAWLHDCGKVTTPEHVIDKSTKLETIYNRIHEIRTRFEVIKRDIELDIYRSRFASQLSKEEREHIARECSQLDNEYQLVAKANNGSHQLTDHEISSLEIIGQRTWLRTFDDKVGLSHFEQKLRGKGPFTQPVLEQLLMDANYHLIPWLRVHKHDQRYSLKATSQQNNLGELYNLTIARGTLNAEERYTIKSHVIETNRMLEQLPFPKHLGDVAKLASTHHETMDGTGYPWGLTKEYIPVPSRAMAIADIFEALTSPDRPYKTQKTLSETLIIMAKMAKNKKIDESLFRLLLTSGVYKKYAEASLHREQIDEISVELFIEKHLA
ncbi:GAF domain-containing protein [Vibrio sp. ZSDZ34]|uniref:GAF domain-containing protein n=1 Tax=Vibrio gelatinilyticus TaxID=2893468 RepID=A0A9X1WCC3_9VIBR|nr:HD domain-containing phosphohydrolase [Vibrio gelatinilyticus]MCJ2377686.1 GAF domain-containing protein [Vibrio gelatinilyticus]